MDELKRMQQLAGLKPLYESENNNIKEAGFLKKAALAGALATSALSGNAQSKVHDLGNK